MKYPSHFASRRKTSRLIRRAMAGAALGAGFLVLPASAATHIVTNPNDSGTGSLRDSITAANGDADQTVTIGFDNGLGNDPTFGFTSGLPTLINNNLNSVTTLNTAGIGGNGCDAAADPNAFAGASGGNGGAGGAGYNGGNGGAGGSGTKGADGINGGTDENGNGIDGTDGTAGGNAGLGGAGGVANGGTTGSDGVDGHVGVGGNGGNGGDGGDGGSISGNGGAGGAGGYGGEGANMESIGGDGGDGGNGGVGGSTTGGTPGAGGNGGIGGGGGNGGSGDTGDAGNDGSDGADGAVDAGNGGNGGAGEAGDGGSSGIGGNGGNGGVGGVGGNGGNGGVGEAGDGGSSGTGGNGGNGGAGGVGGNGGVGGPLSFQPFALEENGSYYSGGAGGNAYIEGDFVGNGSSVLELHTLTDGGLAYVGGDATFNGASSLTSYGHSALNTNGGTTTFENDAVFAPVLDSANPNANYVTVDSLVLHNSVLQPVLVSPESAYVLGQTYDVLHYNSLTGTFGTIDGQIGSTQNILTYGVDYGDGTNDNIELTLVDADFTNAGGNKNQRSLEQYLNDLIAGPGLPGVLNNLPAALINNGPDALNNYIPDNLAAHGEQTFFSQQAFMASMENPLYEGQTAQGENVLYEPSLQMNRNGMNRQLAALRQAMTPGVNRLNLNGKGADAGNKIWAAYNGNHQNTDADSGIGSSAWSSSSNGYTLGYTFGNGGFRWGVAAGHQESDLSFSDINASGEVAGYNAGLYAAWTGKSTFVHALVGYGDYNNETQQLLGSNTFNTKAVSGTLKLGKHFGSSQNQLTPYLALNWTRIKNDGFSGGSSDLSVRSGSNNVYSTTLGVRYNHRMYNKDGSLKGGFNAGLGWLHQVGDTDFSVDAGYSGQFPGAFRAQTTPLDGNLLQVQLGAYGRIHHNLIGYAGYQGAFGSSQKMNAVNVGVGYQF